MKVWEKITHDNNLKDKNEVRDMIKSNCPAGYEATHNYIGAKRINKFCNLGCSVICTDEYLDLKVKEGEN